MLEVRVNGKETKETHIQHLLNQDCSVESLYLFGKQWEKQI